MAEDTSKKRMNQKEHAAVIRYLDKHKESFSGMAPDTLLSMIKDGTGVELTRGNLLGLREIDGLEWVFPRRTKRKAKQTSGERVLAEAVIRIYQDLDMEIPDALQELADGGE